MSDACQLMNQKWGRPIGRSTIYNALRDDTIVREMAKQCAGVTFDICYRGMLRRAEDGNARDQRILFNRLAHDHGMPAQQRVEISGVADGPPIKYEAVGDAENLSNKQILALLSDDDLAAYLIAVKVINGPRSIQRTDVSHASTA